jgi:hypothetical protein
MTERIVCIEWEGPHPYSSIKKDGSILSGTRDRGLYQIYVHHPIYGAGVLAYIGQTMRGTFCERVLARAWGEGSENDPRNVQVYVGRLKYPQDAMPSVEAWEADILNAERLLIHAHGPAYNATHLDHVREGDTRVRTLRVLSFGAVRALQREVSGKVWTTDAKQFENYQIFDRSTAAVAELASLPSGAAG